MRPQKLDRQTVQFLGPSSTNYKETKEGFNASDFRFVHAVAGSLRWLKGAPPGTWPKQHRAKKNIFFEEFAFQQHARAMGPLGDFLAITWPQLSRAMRQWRKKMNPFQSKLIHPMTCSCKPMRSYWARIEKVRLSLSCEKNQDVVLLNSGDLPAGRG